MIDVAHEVITPAEADALAAFVDVTDVDDSGRCRLLPYSAIDPCTDDSQRQLKYLLNQVRQRALQVVERVTRRHQLYAAATALRLRRGPLLVAPDPADWWTEYKAVVPLVEARVERHGDCEVMAPGSLVVAPGHSTWVVAAAIDDAWLSVTINLTDQLDRCEL